MTQVLKEIADVINTIFNLSNERIDLLKTFINDFKYEDSKSIETYESSCKLIEIQPEDAKKIIRIIGFIAGAIIEDNNQNSVSILKKNVSQYINDKDMEEKGWQKIEYILDNVPLFFLEKKADILSDDFDLVKNYSVVCDIRPVFNRDRTDVGRFLYPVILKLTDRTEHNFRFELNEYQVDNLIKSLIKAQSKIKILKEKCVL
jgi:hypothetical protein